MTKKLDPTIKCGFFKWAYEKFINVFIRKRNADVPISNRYSLSVNYTHSAERYCNLPLNL